MIDHLIFTENLPAIKGCDVDYLFEVAEYFFRLSITARREGILALEDYFSGDTWKNEEQLYLIEKDDASKTPVLRPHENHIFTPIVRCVTECIESDKIIERAELFLKKSCPSDLEKFALIVGINSILAIQSALPKTDYIVRIASLFGTDFVGECERRLRKMSDDIYNARYKKEHEIVAVITDEIKERLLKVDSILRKKEIQLKHEMTKLLSDDDNFCPPKEQKIPIQFISGNMRFSSNDGTTESLVAEEAGWGLSYSLELLSVPLNAGENLEDFFEDSPQYELECENGKISVCHSTKELWGNTHSSYDAFCYHAEDFMRLTENFAEDFGKHITFMISVTRRFIMESE